MKIIDLSHTICEDMPVFPGTPQPGLSPVLTIAEHGFGETMLHIMSHTGTHIDAPSHMIAPAPSLDDFPVDKFFGLALIIDYPPCAQELIELKALQQMREKIECAEFVLFNTGHSQKWGAREYFGGFPILTREAAEFLAAFPLKGVGIDAISFDKLDAADSPIHKILLSAGLILIENLTNLQQVQGEYCMFAALPLKYKNADGSPVRAFAIQMPEAR
jgi:kynurenine formamidase